MDWLVIISVCFILPIIALVIFVFNTFEKSNGVTAFEMYKFEKDISKNLMPLFDKKDCFEVAKSLKLFIENDVDSSRIHGKESQLGPTAKEGYNGEILIAKTDTEFLPRFRCYHELIHYFKDVGRGKKVCRVYGKDPQGETKSHREQIINYYAAAIAVPKDELLSDLKGIPEPTQNDRFIEGLMHKYQQPKATILRRIEEVSLL